MCDQIRFFAGAARVLEGQSAGEYMRGFTSFVRREPVGVCAAVTPWNYPAMMAVWKWAPALAAGNTMVLKTSDTTPASTVWMAEVMAEFLPAGVFNVVCGDRDTGAALVQHPTPQMVSITGSVRAGMAVAKAAADAESTSEALILVLELDRRVRALGEQIAEQKESGLLSERHRLAGEASTKANDLSNKTKSVQQLESLAEEMEKDLESMRNRRIEAVKAKLAAGQ